MERNSPGRRTSPSSGAPAWHHRDAALRRDAGLCETNPIVRRRRGVTFALHTGINKYQRLRIAWERRDDTR